MILAALLACRDPAPIGPDACDDVNAALGYTACLQEIPDRATWEVLSVDAPAVDQDRSTKYLFPATVDAPLPPLFVNANQFALHSEFLATVFPDLYPGMDQAAYVDLVARPGTRTYLAGNVTEYLDADGGTSWGFTLWDVDGCATYEEVLGVWEELGARFQLGETRFVPSTSAQRDAAAAWDDAPFGVRGEDDVVFEAYNVGEAYGTVRLQAAATLEEASAAADFGWQDILVLDEAPFDLERVVSGLITGSRQAALSHLSVRSAARGTPNAFVDEPFDAFAAWEGQLVHLVVAEDGYTVEAADPAVAQAWWDELRPDPDEIPAPDLAEGPPIPLLSVPTDTLAERDAAVARYGAKGANLATLYQRIDAELQLDGFVVPMAAYDAFVRDGTWTWDGETRSFADTLDAWLADESFLTDPAERQVRLAALRDAMAEAPVDDALLDALGAQIEATFGSDEVMLRFRSSSNAEDGVAFSGAGLYESASACLADERDDDDEGPSRCDPDKDEERTVSDALRTVWASLWAAGAYEERDWYGIDHGQVAMGMLVNTQADDELANIVAFTGNPTADDDRWLVEAQLGDLDVVSAEAGVTPERILLTMEDGEVATILRVADSSEADEVLSDAQLEALGAAFWTIDSVFPVDDAAPEGSTLLWDTEWKVLEDGRLVVKQIRPFVR